MKKNKTAEKYLAQVITPKWDIIFGSTVALGVILFFFGWGWGFYFSIPIVIVGAAGFILARSARVSDEDYLGIIDRILADNGIEKNASRGEIILSSFLMKDSEVTRGIDKTLRSGRYCTAEFVFSKGECKIKMHTIDVKDGSVTCDTYTVPLTAVPAIQSEDVETRFGTVKQNTLVFPDAGIAIPVDTNSADVDEVIRRFGR